MTSPRLGCNKYKIDLNILSKNNIIRQMEDILYCAPCIIPIDTKKQQKNCIYEGCKIYPLYNFTGENKALYCFQHKINGMNDIINKNNEKINSCWKLNKMGIIQIQKNKLNEWNNRLETLKSQIEYWSKEENKTSK